MSIIKKILFFLIIACIAVFIFQNLNSINIRFITWELRITQSVLIVIVYVLGMLSGGLLLSILKKLWSDQKKV